MPDQTIILLTTAIALGVVHTVLGPDHYLPFVMLAEAQGWSKTKMLMVTVLSGAGHVLGSVVLGMAGIALGVALQHLEFIEGIRGSIAAWALIVFGFLYLLWGLRRAWPAHVHVHRHQDGTVHTHAHEHRSTKMHRHPHGTVTVWSLFIIFVLGPCEPLIPLLMYPAAGQDGWLVAGVATAFGIATIGTMVIMTLALSRGMHLISRGGLERYSHALAGGLIFCTGLAIIFLGL